jgi:leucyl aminopeptidase
MRCGSCSDLIAKICLHVYGGLMTGSPIYSAARTDVSAASAPADQVGADLIVLPCFATGPAPAATRDIGARLGIDVTAVVERVGLTQVGQVQRLVLGRHTAGPDVVLACLGRREDAVDAATLRTLGASVGRRIEEWGAATVACALGGVPVLQGDPGTIVAESILIGAYTYNGYRRAGTACRVLLTGTSEAAVHRGRVLGMATNRTRDLVNSPAADLNPETFAAACATVADGTGIRVRVLDGAELRAGQFGGIVDVGKGSDHEPLLVVMELGEGTAAQTALVGKGVTFDTGGIQVKAASKLPTMKQDMAGAASILHAFGAAAELGVDVHATAYLPLAENAIGPRAVKPGDVVRHRNGRTTEVVSTDAEGRLILADAMTYALEHAPAELVTVSTLTGATGLGPDIWGLLGTDDRLAELLLDCGIAAGEPGWRLPLWEPYRAEFHSEVADLTNYSFATNEKIIGGPYSAILGAVFLRDFIDATPWAHLDMAATSWSSETTGERAFGATGSTTRTLVHYLEHVAAGAGHDRKVGTP